MHHFIQAVTPATITRPDIIIIQHLGSIIKPGIITKPIPVPDSTITVAKPTLVLALVPDTMVVVENVHAASCASLLADPTITFCPHVHIYLRMIKIL